jgi:hypothetical protein
MAKTGGILKKGVRFREKEESEDFKPVLSSLGRESAW